jgi:hypothetical protein
MWNSRKLNRTISEAQVLLDGVSGMQANTMKAHFDRYYACLFLTLHQNPE